jgi:hypothetical protein
MRAMAAVRESLPEEELGQVIAARLRRQAIMYEPGRQIVHVVGGGALRTRIGSMTTGTPRAQVLRLADMATLEVALTGAEAAEFCRTVAAKLGDG